MPWSRERLKEYKSTEEYKEYNRKYMEKYRKREDIAEHQQEYQKEYRDKNKDCRREYHKKYALAKKYNLTEESYEILLEQQKYSCAICETHISNLSKRLEVDHDHDTGAIRGLLCHHCNVGLGYFRDNKTSLVKAVSYLELASNEAKDINIINNTQKIDKGD